MTGRAMTPSQLHQLAQRALRCWGVQESVPRLLKHRENAVFAVTMADSRPAVLRIHRAGYHSDAALRSELEWMRFLNAQGVPTPLPISTPDGDVLALVEDGRGGSVRQVDCLSWVEGRMLGEARIPLAMPDGEAVRVFTQIGRVMAVIHDTSSGWRRPAGFTRHAWDFDAFFGATPLWGRFRDSPWLDEEQLRTVSSGAARAAEQLTSHECSDRNFGLIHADMVRENILLDAGGLHVIDFDDCGFGWHLYDLAVALYQNRQEPNYAVMEAALLEGYRSRRLLSDEDVEALPLFIALRGLALIGWWAGRPAKEAVTAIARPISAIAAEAVGDFLSR